MTNTVTAAPARQRIKLLDVLRGLAILLMIVDHALVVFDAPEILRYLTRPALPMFMMTMGYLIRPGWRIRHLELLVAALVSWPMAVQLGIADVPILVVLALVLPLVVWGQGYPVVLAATGVMMMSVWPIDWVGYHPGTLVALIALGIILRDRQPEFDVSWGVVEAIGRYPLTFYVGHLGALWALAWVAAA